MRMNLAGISVGHHTDLAGATGCTVILAPGGATASVEVRGGAPGTRETDLLSPHSTVDEVHAILLTGGRAFGLAAATGVVRFLEERGYGYDTPYPRDGPQTLPSSNPLLPAPYLQWPLSPLPLSPLLPPRPPASPPSSRPLLLRGQWRSLYPNRR